MNLSSKRQTKRSKFLCSFLQHIALEHAYFSSFLRRRVAAARLRTPKLGRRNSAPVPVFGKVFSAFFSANPPNAESGVIGFTDSPATFVSTINVVSFNDNACKRNLEKMSYFFSIFLIAYHLTLTPLSDWSSREGKKRTFLDDLSA